MDADWLSTTIVTSPGRWAGLVITAGPAAVAAVEAVARLDEDERAAAQRLGRARLPRHHPSGRPTHWRSSTVGWWALSIRRSSVTGG